jgi:hypothetical protein
MGSAGLPAAIRAGASRMTRERSAALMAVQRAISSIVRPQPRHSPERASSMQIFTQGLSIIAYLDAESFATINAVVGNAIARF